MLVVEKELEKLPVPLLWSALEQLREWVVEVPQMSQIQQLLEAEERTVAKVVQVLVRLQEPRH